MEIGKDVELTEDEQFEVISKIRKQWHYEQVRARSIELLREGKSELEAANQAEKEISINDIEIDIEADEFEIHFKQAKEEKYYKQKTNAYFHDLDSTKGLATIKNDLFISEVITKLFKIVDVECLEENFDKVFTENNIRQFNLLKWYFCQDQEFEKTGFSFKKGLLVTGRIGCGKSTFMEVFRKNPIRSYNVVSCRSVADAYKSEGVAGIVKFYNYQANKFPPVYYGQKELGWCFDDLGTEDEKGHFGDKANVMKEIISTWYDKKNHLGLNNIHITTNLTGPECETYYGNRVRSRMVEMFNVIKFDSSAKDLRK
jgi:hypothetical protein